MAKKKTRLNKSSIAAIALIAICCAVFLYSLIKVIDWHASNQKNNAIKEELKESIVVDEDSENKYTIDFTSLKERNDETVGYVKINGTNIDYVVVQGKDNDYYLNHNFDREQNEAGWIFADYRNNIAEDTNVIIYGHNTKDGSMFGSLHNALNKKWYENEDNLDIVFVTEKGTSIYTIISVYTIDKEDAVMPTSFDNNDEYQKFIDTILARSINTFDTEITTDDKLLTLSTCASDNNSRVIVHAKMAHLN